MRTGAGLRLQVLKRAAALATSALLATRPLRGTLACSRCCGYSSAIAFSYSARSASGCGKRCGGWPCPWRCPESLTPRSLSLIFKARSCVRARVLPRSGVLPRVSPHSHTPQPDQASAVCPPAALGSASGHQPPLRPPKPEPHESVVIHFFHLSLDRLRITGVMRDDRVSRQAYSYTRVAYRDRARTYT